MARIEGTRPRKLRGERVGEHGKRGRPPGDPIGAAHRTSPAASMNSVVRAMSIMYVRCVPDLEHDIFQGQSPKSKIIKGL